MSSKTLTYRTRKVNSIQLFFQIWNIKYNNQCVITENIFIWIDQTDLYTHVKGGIPSSVLSSSDDDDLYDLLWPLTFTNTNVETVLS